MAQEQTGIDAIINELEKINEREQHLRASVKSIIQNQKSKTQDQQKQKEQNVTKKLPTILTSSEKRRYQEIGKRFLLGAETQFSNIKKGIRLKEMMKTSKDFFLKGFEKIKNSGAELKKSNFWKILLGSLVVIGMAAYLFRDKIAKLIPDVSGQTGNIFQRMTKFIGNMLKQIWDFIADSLIGGISGILGRLFNDSIPKMLRMFFYETLPNAIFNTYLLIMSMFDPTATELASGIDSETEGDILGYTRNPDNANGGSADEDDLNMVRHLQKMNDQLAKVDTQKGTVTNMGRNAATGVMNNLSTYLMYYEDVGNGRDNATGVNMNNVRTAIEGALNLKEGGLRDLVKTGKFDSQAFIDYIRRGKDFREALMAAVQNSGDDDLKGNAENVQKGKVGEGDITNMKNYVQAVKGLLQSHMFFADDGKMSDTDKYKFNSMKEVYANMSTIFADRNLINAQFTKGQIVNRIASFMDAASKFMSNNGLIQTIKNNVVNMSTTIGEIFRDFFGKAYKVLSDVANGVASYVNPGSTNTKIVVDKVSDGTSVNGNVIVVNVDLTGNQASAIADALGGFAKAQMDVVTSINETTAILKTTNEKLVNIGDIHGVNMQAWNAMYKLILNTKHDVTVNAEPQDTAFNSDTPGSHGTNPTHVA